MPPLMVLVARQLNIGGIETLMVRLAQAYCESGQRVVVVAQGDGALLASLPKQAQVFAYDQLSISQMQQVAQRIGALGAQQLQLISCEPATRFMAELMAQAMLREQPHLDIRYISGCFHPRAYWLEEELALRHHANRWLANYLGNELLFFMNMPCLEPHIGVLRGITSSSPLFHVPVRVAAQAWQPAGDPAALEILSVGRLVPFKCYVFGLIEAVNALIAKGHAVRLTIYGYGEQEQALRDAIAALPHAAAIRFLGALPYEEFEQEVRGYDLFVGVGTAAMEAAAMGAPTLLGIDSDKHYCYGYIQQVPLGVVGEVVDGCARITFEQAIEAHLGFSAEERQEKGAQARALYSQLTPTSYAQQLTQMLGATARIERSWRVRWLLIGYFLLCYQGTRWVGNKLLRLKRPAA